MAAATHNRLDTSMELDPQAILTMLVKLRQGDFSQRMPAGLPGITGKIAEALNDLAEHHSTLSEGLGKLSRRVQNGHAGEQLSTADYRGAWSDSVHAVNAISDQLHAQIDEISDVFVATTEGHLDRKIDLEDSSLAFAGGIRKKVKVINRNIDGLQGFAHNVTEFTKDISEKGVLGKQLAPDMSTGCWVDISNNLNTMSEVLTKQLRDISDVTASIAKGDLSKSVTTKAQGEILTVKTEINSLVEMLSSFISEIGRVTLDLGADGRLGGQATVPYATGIWKDLTENVNQLARNLTAQVRAISDVATAVTKGDYSQKVEVEVRGEISQLNDNVNIMIETLSKSTEINDQQNWLKSNLASFTKMLQGERDIEFVSQTIISELARIVGAQHGAMYLAATNGNETWLKLAGSYAYRKREDTAPEIRMGEGLVGQCAMEKSTIQVRAVPENYIKVSSGLGKHAPENIIICPVTNEGQIKAVVELASFHDYTEVEHDFLEQIFEILGTILVNIESTQRTEDLLKQSQLLAEELQNQQEELKQTNEELEEKAREVIEQNQAVERKNLELEFARTQLEEKAQLLARSSEYKSEFLANMSHELRTPLNSLLILSQQLSENIDGNLTDKQVKFAETIYSSGKDLLSLIGEILDLAKVESGTMVVNAKPVDLRTIAEKTQQDFAATAAQKGLDFSVDLKTKYPTDLQTDEKRLMQIIRNLMSNAIKFTEKGSVNLTISDASQQERNRYSLQNRERVYKITVRDTGIGIAPGDVEKLFEAFTQADGGPSRSYGGTGLGLPISREFAHLLGGALVAKSNGEFGAEFILLLPDQIHEQDEKEATPSIEWPVVKPELSVAREHSRRFEKIDQVAYSRTLLVIEDDPTFAGIMQRLAEKQGFGVLLARTGQEGLEMARAHNPDAITLDLFLPDMHGWVILDRLKNDPKTKDIPVHILSVDGDVQQGETLGAIEVLSKPIDNTELANAISSIGDNLSNSDPALLIASEDESLVSAIIELIQDTPLNTLEASTGRDAISAVTDNHIDCMIVDLTMKGGAGLKLIREARKINSLASLHIVAIGESDLNSEDIKEAEKYSNKIVMKEVDYLERLRDETLLFLHKVEAGLPPSRRDLQRSEYSGDRSLSGKRILIVDDDPRNIFATTSILERQDILVEHADTGREGLDTLERDDGFDLILMDIMMPEMDGFEAISEIRKMERFSKIPIIALTAKAMPEDRKRCIDAGASDYIVKPVESQQLVSLLRVWLCK